MNEVASIKVDSTGTGPSEYALRINTNGQIELTSELGPISITSNATNYEGIVIKSKTLGIYTNTSDGGSGGSAISSDGNRLNINAMSDINLNCENQLNISAYGSGGQVYINGGGSGVNINAFGFIDIRSNYGINITTPSSSNGVKINTGLVALQNKSGLGTYNGSGYETCYTSLGVDYAVGLGVNIFSVSPMLYSRYGANYCEIRLPKTSTSMNFGQLYEHRFRVYGNYGSTYVAHLSIITTRAGLYAQGGSQALKDALLDAGLATSNAILPATGAYNYMPNKVGTIYGVKLSGGTTPVFIYSAFDDDNIDMEKPFSSAMDYVEETVHPLFV